MRRLVFEEGFQHEARVHEAAHSGIEAHDLPHAPACALEGHDPVDVRGPDQARIAVGRIAAGPPPPIGKALSRGLVPLRPRPETPPEDMRLEQHSGPALIVEAGTCRLYVDDGVDRVFTHTDPATDARQVDVFDPTRRAFEIRHLEMVRH